MKKNEIIERLEKIHAELNLDPQQYADMVNERNKEENEKHGWRKLTSESAWAYRTGSISAQIEFVLDKLKRA